MATGLLVVKPLASLRARGNWGFRFLSCFELRRGFRRRSRDAFALLGETDAGNGG